MNYRSARRRIHTIFGRYKKLAASEDTWVRRLKSGKVYELFCLAEVIEELRQNYGYRPHLVGNSIRFQSSPGRINQHGPHFELRDQHKNLIFELYTDIEFRTLGAGISSASGLSSYHEIDIVVVYPEVVGYPDFDRIALGVECKSHGVFQKQIVKEVLGIRRELSLLVAQRQSTLASASPNRPPKSVPADPSSEYWLVFIDPRGYRYSDSPAAFGIEFKNWHP